MADKSVPKQSGAAQESGPKKHRFSLRLKMLTAFAGAYTIVFTVIAIWTFSYITEVTQNRLIHELHSRTEGGASTINGANFHELVTTVPSVGGPALADGTGAGYPDSPLYMEAAVELRRVSKIVSEAGVYSFFRDPADGKLYYGASAGYLKDPQRGVTYRVPVETFVADESTYKLMEQALEKTTDQPAYSDEYGSYIAAYSPIFDEKGESVGAIGLDYPLDYVAEVQASARSRIIPVMVVAYLVLLFLVLFLATTLSRPIKRLTAATERIANGEYNLDLSSMMKTRFPDEIYSLAQSVATMAAKVGAREQSLTQEVQRLKVEIDESRRSEAVKQITESAGFSDLAAKAAEMRRRMREE